MRRRACPSGPEVDGSVEDGDAADIAEVIAYVMKTPYHDVHHLLSYDVLNFQGEKMLSLF